MPTPEVTGSAASQSEEIKKIAREYAMQVYPKEPYEDIGQMEFLRDTFVKNATKFISLLSKDFVIVPKSKVREWQGIVENALKADLVITEPAFRFMWERLFGKSLFNEEKG